LVIRQVRLVKAGDGSDYVPAYLDIVADQHHSTLDDLEERQ